MNKVRPRVIATRHFPPEVEARLTANFDAQLNPEDRLYDGPALAKASVGFDGIMCAAGDALNAATIAALPDSVRMIATFSVGYEHVDVAAAAKRNILVSNTPDVLTDATADITMLCLLGAARRAHEGAAMLRTHNWVGWTPTQLMGTHVTGKRLGILGMGRIGQATADRARAFRMQIHYSNRSRLAPDLEKGAVFHANPEDMLPHCDFLSINAPMTPATAKWVNAERIARLPKATLAELGIAGLPSIGAAVASTTTPASSWANARRGIANSASSAAIHAMASEWRLVVTAGTTDTPAWLASPRCRSRSDRCSSYRGSRPAG